jgi:hypothetical protein
VILLNRAGGLKKPFFQATSDEDVGLTVVRFFGETAGFEHFEHSV